MTYTVIYNPGADNESRSTHRNWQAAFRAARSSDVENIEVVESDRDGRRTYDIDGNVISYD